MSRLRQFSLRTLLLATAGIGVLMFLFMLPTVRVNRFARLIDAGSTADVIAMLDASIGENDAYRSMLETCAPFHRIE
jgi:hypothetical protein